jgi:hypothetical protein
MARREAARAREESPDTVPVTGGGNIMGGDDSFAAAKARFGACGQTTSNKQLLYLFAILNTHVFP